MKNISKKRAQELRRERNLNLLRRMVNGDPLTAFNSASSWFPPRPIIKKNAADVELLYGASLDKRLLSAAEGEDPEEKEVSADNKATPMRIA